MIIKEKIDEIRKLNHPVNNICSKKTFEGIIDGNIQYSGLKDKPSYLLNLNAPDAGAQLEADMETCCMEYKSSKSTIINVFNELLSRLGFSERLEVPSINYESNTERQLYLLRFFNPEQNMIKTTNTLAEAHKKLWMYSEERIIDDLNDIKNGSLSFLGKKIEIDFDRENGIVSCYSTAHPIIMVENLTQILVQLEGLRAMSLNKAYERYAINSAQVIWHQLSDYAKNRIKDVLHNLMNIETISMTRFK